MSLRQVIEEDPAAAATVADLVAAAQRDIDALEARVRGWLAADRDLWRDRALSAEARLARIEARFADLID